MATYKVWVEVEEVDDDGTPVPDTSHSFDVGGAAAFETDQYENAMAAAQILQKLGEGMNNPDFVRALTAVMPVIEETLAELQAVRWAQDFLHG